MKRLYLIFVFLIAISTFSFAQQMTKKINRIDVDFDKKFVKMTITDGTYDKNGNFTSTGMSTVSKIKEPAFSQTLNYLEQQNAIDMNKVLNVLTNN